MSTEESHARETVDTSGLTSRVQDATDRGLGQAAAASLQPKFMRLFGSEAVPIIKPGTLRGAFTPEEASRLPFNDRCYEISDIVGSRCFSEIQRRLRALSTNDRERPFDLSMVVGHMHADEKGTAVETVPCNVVQIHTDKFDLEDPETARLFRFISSNLRAEETAKNALALEIRGAYPKEMIEGINQTIEMWESEYGYRSRIVRPPLSAALQSAIARTCTQDTQARPCVTVTDTNGPEGTPIIIHSIPGRRIILSQGNPLDHPFRPISVTPTEHYMLREL